MSAYTDADRSREVVQIRSEFVDDYVTRRIDHREGDCTTEQVRGWEDEAYAMWRDRHPALSSLLPTHLTTEATP